MKSESKAKRLMKEYGIILLLLAEICFFAIRNERFFTVSNLLTVLRQVSMIGIASVGMMVVLIIGQIDLSIGSGVSLTCVIGAMFMQSGMNPWLASLITVCIMAVAGLIQGVVIAKIHVPAFIVTMSFMNILSGAAFLLTMGKPIYGFSDTFTQLGQGYLGPIPIPVIVMVLCLLFGWYLVSKSYFGRYFYALGGNEEAAHLSGIHVDKVKIAAFVLSSIFACLSGLVLLGRINTGNPSNGTGFEFDVITACVIGGISTTGGVGRASHIIIGALIIGVLNNGMIMLGMTEYVQLIIKGVILVMAVSLDQIQKRRETKKMIVTDLEKTKAE